MQTVSGAVTGVVNGVSTAVFGKITDLTSALNLTVAAPNFAAGKCSGYGYCIPVKQAPSLAAPTKSCGAGFKNYTVAGITTCKKEFNSSVSLCVPSAFKCPTGMASGNQTCTQLRFDVMSGLLALWKLAKPLPTTLLPPSFTGLLTLANPLAAIKLPPMLPLPAKPDNGLADFAKLLFAVPSADWHLAPLKAFLDAAAANVTGFAAAHDAAKPYIPLCTTTCCLKIEVPKATLKEPTVTCPSGCVADPLGAKCLCVFKACPAGMTRCPAGPTLAMPVCVTSAKLWGMDSCDAMAALSLVAPKYRCPSA